MLRALVVVPLLLTVGCVGPRGKQEVTVEIHGTPTIGFLDIAGKCMGSSAGWSVRQLSSQPDIGNLTIPADTFADREEQVVSCLRRQPGVTDVRVRR